MAAAVALALAVPLGGGGTFALSAQDAAPDFEAEGPAQLLERGRAAFEANDFAGAEDALEKFIRDYGEAEEAKEAVRIHRPLVALSKVGLQKFGEALEWIDASLADEQLPFLLRDELAFWRGICHMTLGDWVEAQHSFGRYWAVESHNGFKRHEALLLFATLYLQQDFPEVAADFLADQVPKIRDAAPEAAGRGVVLQLYARLAAGQRAEALRLVEEEFPNLGRMTQAITFQTLALQLGASFLDEGEWYEAIACLQRIWPAERLLEHQAAKAGEIEERIAHLETQPNTGSIVHQLKSILRRVEREVENFREIENFDSALKMRLATAYRQLERYRESALIMAGMLETLPPDEIVESATLAQMQCWMEIRRWDAAIKVAERYERVFGPEGRFLPTVLFLRAEALREQQDLGAAQLAYGRVVEFFPEDPMAANARFMQGFLYLQQDDNEGALFQFDQVQRHHPDSPMVEDADYWTGMAYSYSAQYDEAREHLRGYLERHSPPKYRKEALFRIAVCTFSLAEYAESLELLEAFVAAYPGDPLVDEAYLLIGDAYFGDGEVEPGFAAYAQVRPESGRFFEEAWFKAGNAHKLLEEYETMREHFERFVAEFPRSPRMPEAVYWVGWVHSAEGEPERAREIYWKTVEAHGDDPEMTTITDVFAALPRAYQGEGEEGAEALMQRLHSMKSRAVAEDRRVLAVRAGWAMSNILGSRHPDRARAALLDLARLVDPKEDSPVLSVPVAEALLASGNRLTAKELFTEIRRWHPRAVQKDRIYRGLGEIALAEGETEEALRFFQRFEREALDSVHLAEMKLKRAEIFRDLGRGSEARSEWEAVLEMPAAGAETKAGALLAIGTSLAEDGKYREAIVYFERVYVAYGKFAELNARAYGQRGRALEQLGMGREALETYEELLGREELRRYEEYEAASARAAVLRREFPEERVDPDLSP